MSAEVAQQDTPTATRPRARTTESSRARGSRSSTARTPASPYARASRSGSRSGPPAGQLPAAEGADARAEPAHRLRGGPLPQHRRVLGGADRHLHDPGRCLHPRVRFCAVAHGPPEELDRDEPRRRGGRGGDDGAQHAVITCVNRDELPDGGAEIFAETIRAIRRRSPAARRGADPGLRGELGRAAPRGRGSARRS